MAGLAVVLAATVSGCVSLQANGPVTSVNQGGEGSSQVQIWPSPPTANEAPTAIVTGFLQAARSGSANQAIADDYLTAAVQKQWQSEQNTVIVLADDSQSSPQPPGNDTSASGNTAQSSSALVADGPENPSGGSASNADAATGGGGTEITEEVQGNLLGTLDSSGLYSASSHSETYDFGLTDTKAGYRISSLPPSFGVLMERSDFESSYSRHDVYYENAQYPSRLIPSQIYLPAIDTDQDLATAMARLVVNGVPEQLVPALQDSVRGATFRSVQVGGDGDATVTINSGGYCVKSASACDSLGQQLAATLNSLSTKVTSVTVVDQANGDTYPPVSADSALVDYGLTQGARGTQPFYAIANDGTVEQVSTFGTASASKISYGSGNTRFKAVAVGPIQEGSKAQPVALVSQDGTKVYVPHKQGATYDVAQIFPTGSSPSGGAVGGLSWDDYGNLWFTVTLNGETTVYRYGEGAVSQVTVGGLNGQVTQVAAAPDGDRVAVGYKDSAGDYWIAISAVSSGTDGSWRLGLGGSEVVAASWDQINDFDWYNEDSLAVLGIEPNSQVLGLYQIYADGSSVYDSLTEQPVEASPPANAVDFVWNTGGDPIAAAANSSKNMLYELSVEGQDAQQLSGVFGTSPSY